MFALTKQINTISRASAMYRMDRLEDCELKPRHYSYVFAVCKSPGISQEELSRELCLHKSNVARHLAFLEEHGYINREKSAADKRELLVYPTEKMTELLPRLRAVSREWNGYLTEGLSEEELESFYSVMLRISERARLYASGGKENDQ